MNNFILSFGIAFIFAIFDVIGFRNASDIPRYRKIQATVQIILAISSLLLFDWQVSIGFLTLWWYWICDLIYYLIYDFYAYLFNKPTGFKNEVLGNQVTWAWWTPVGLLFYKKDQVIKWPTLLIQAIFGIVILYLLNII